MLLKTLNSFRDQDYIARYSKASQAKPTLMFYCQSSLGIGHTMRSLRIINELREHFNVTFVNGGAAGEYLQVPNDVSMVQLLPISTDKEFNDLQCDVSGVSVEKALSIRKETLLRTFQQVSPQCVIVELFPFGRGAFSTELKPLLKHARRNNSYCVSSVRDILVPKKNQNAYEEKVVRRLNKYFDALLVHGDQSFYSFEKSFSRISSIEANVHYTGYVTPEVTHFPSPTYDSTQPIVASIGGGRFGHELAFAVIEAAKFLQNIIPNQFILSTGPVCPAEIEQQLRKQSASLSNITVVRYLENLHEKLAESSLSISMGGYNTTMDVLTSGVPAIMLACKNNGGMDQATRLELLSASGLVRLINHDELEFQKLGQIIIELLQQGRREHAINISGARNTALILKETMQFHLSQIRPANEKI